MDPDAKVEDISVGMQQRVEILKVLYRGADTLIAIMAHNPDSLRFYRSVENATIHDEAVWMDL